MTVATWFRRIALGTVATLTLAGGAASAGTLDWTFDFSLSNGDTGSGTFVTQDSPAGGPYLITSLTGQVAGAAMTLLTPDGSFNDNLLSTTQPYLDAAGLGFVADGAQWAIWSAGGSSVDSWCNNSVTGADHSCTFASDPNGAVLSFNLSSAGVPEPATWAMLILGLGMVGFVARRRREDLALAA